MLLREILIEMCEMGMWREYDAMCQLLFQFWNRRFFHLNPGQQTIFIWYLDPTVHEWVDGAFFDWPDVESADYMEALYSCYDPDVMERAFTDSIEEPTTKMEEHIEKARELRDIEEFLESLPPV